MKYILPCLKTNCKCCNTMAKLYVFHVNVSSDLYWLENTSRLSTTSSKKFWCFSGGQWSSHHHPSRSWSDAGFPYLCQSARCSSHRHHGPGQVVWEEPLFRPCALPVGLHHHDAMNHLWVKKRDVRNWPLKRYPKNISLSQLFKKKTKKTNINNLDIIGFNCNF